MIIGLTRALIATSLVMLVSATLGAQAVPPDRPQSSAKTADAEKAETLEQAIARGTLAELESDIAEARLRAAHARATARAYEAQADYIKARYENEIALRKSEVSLFTNQQTMELPIVALVFLIVLTSLYLAHVQLRGWMSRQGTDQGSTTALSISKEGLTLNTPFVGLLMLVGAFAFFYMYIDKVYSVQPRSEALRKQLDQYGEDGKKQQTQEAPASNSTNPPAEQTTGK